MQNQSKILIYFSLVATVYLGFLFNENAGGGAKIDQEYLLKHIFEISYNLIDGLIIYVNDPGTLIHSPVFYILVGYILKFSNSFLLINLLYILLSCFLPFIFYLILTSKFNRTNQVIFFLSIIIFFSPYFRSSAIWVLGDNLSLMFFSLSIFFFIKTKKNTLQIKNYFLCLFFLILCCYIRYYYCLFYVYFLYMIFYEFKLNLRLKTYLFLFSLIFALPAILYFIYITQNHNFLDALSTFGGTNYISSSLIIFSIILFYLVPFFWNDLFKIIEYYKKNKISSLIIFTSFFFIYFLNNYFNFLSFSNRGGGVFIKLAKLMDINLDITIIILGAISILILNYFFDKAKLRNYLILVILIFSLSLNTIYQKYLDPVFIIIFFSLINSNVICDKINKHEINLSFIFLYFCLFYLFSFYYYS